MQYPEPLQEGILIRRYKRFLADIEIPNGETITMHCPNTGSMRNCDMPGCRVWFSTSENKKRKYPNTWEQIENSHGHRIGINTGRANELVGELFEHARPQELEGFTEIRREVRFGKEKSRIDFLLTNEETGDNCYLEVKSVTLGLEDGGGLFPDAVTTRGQKHLRELIEVVREGQRAVLFFCVQHSGIERVSPADEIDPEYGKLLRTAVESGVEAIAYRAELSADGLKLTERLPVEL